MRGLIEGRTSACRQPAGYGHRAGFGVAAVAALLVALPTAAGQSQTTLTIATGSEQGVYYRLGKDLKSAIEKAARAKGRSITVKVDLTNGSVDNIERLVDGRAQLAFVQNDMVYHFARGTRNYAFPSDDVRGLASLYDEAIHIVARSKTHVERIEGLLGRKVAVGPRDSGTAFSSAAILAAAGMSRHNVECSYLSIEDAGKALRESRIDAAVFVSGVPAPVIADLAKHGPDIQFVRLRPGLVSKLCDRYPYFVPAKIPPRSYKGQTRGVSTVAVRALLVARKDLAGADARLVLAGLFGHADGDGGGHFAPPDMEHPDLLKGMTIPLHPAVMPEANGGIASWVWYAGTIAVALALLVLLVRYWRYVGRCLRRNDYLKITAILVLSIVFSWLLLFWCEHEHNSRYFGTLPEALWSVVVYLVSGLEDRAPETTSGKVISVLVFVMSAGVLAAIIGKFASFFIGKGKVRLPSGLSRHIIICHWGQSGDRIVKEIHSKDGDLSADIVVISPQDVNEAEWAIGPAYHNVYFMKGDPALPEVLRTANVSQARSLIILADPDTPDPDSATAMIALIAKELRTPKSKLHVVSELADPNREKHLTDAGVHETVCAAQFGRGILAQCSLNRELTKVYEELLAYSGESNEIHEIEAEDLPPFIVGMTFQQVASLLNSRRDSANPAVLVGVRRGGEIILNPNQDRRAARSRRFETFQEGDGLLVMAFEDFDLKKLKRPADRPSP